MEEWRDVRLDIDGDDLMAAGIPEGPAIGRGLTAALRAKLDGEVASTEDELRVALDVRPLLVPRGGLLHSILSCWMTRPFEDDPAT